MTQIRRNLICAALGDGALDITDAHLEGSLQEIALHARRFLDRLWESPVLRAELEATGPENDLAVIATAAQISKNRGLDWRWQDGLIGGATYALYQQSDGAMRQVLVGSVPVPS